MKKTRAFFSRMAELWRKDEREHEMEEEFASVVAMEAEANERAGMSAEQAARVARMKLGIEATKEQVRDRRGLPFVETLLQDTRFGLRTLRKNPGFTAVAVITLAVGIGANTAMFSAIDAVLLRGLPFRDPDRLVMVWEKNPALEGFLAERLPVSMAAYREWKNQAHSFEDLSAALYDAANVAGGDAPEHVEQAVITSNFLPLLGVSPLMGRTFTPDETNGGPARFAMISYGMYERRFGKAADILGRSIEIDGVPHRIVGVLPRNFALSGMWEGFDRAKPEVWTPLNTSADQPAEVLKRNTLTVYGRLKDGVTLSDARAEMQVIGKRMASAFPKEFDKFGTNVFTLYTEDVSGKLRRSLLVLQLAVGFVLLLSCVNVSNLLLARASARQQEIAVRLALGASRARVMRQLLNESVLLSAVGIVPTLGMAWAGTRLVGKLAPEDVPGLHAMRLDMSVLLFTAAIAMGASVLFGLAPALQAWGQDLHYGANAGGRGARGRMTKAFRNALAAAEVALALAPLAGAGLMVRTLQAMNALDLGVRTESVVDGRISLPETRYRSEGQVKAFCRELLQAASTVPSVKSAALAGSPPMQSLGFSSFHLEGEKEEREQTLETEQVSDGYFQTMGTPLLRGRDFTRPEAEEERGVAVVAQSVARALWPGQDPIGKALIVEGKRRVVIGVVGDTRTLAIGTEVRQNVYFPTRNLRYMTLIVRSEGSAEAVEAGLRDEGAAHGQHAAALRPAHTVRGGAGKPAGAAVHHVVADHLRRAGPAAGGGGAVWSARLQRGATHARNRDAHGVGRTVARRGGNGPPARVSAGGCGTHDRECRHAAAVAGHG